MSEISDASLLERFRSGDDRALETLLARHEVPLFHFLIGMLRDHHLAEDALQETFVRALERLEGVDPAHLRGWLFTVAYREALVIRRKRKVRQADSLATTDVPSTEIGPSERAEIGDEARQIRLLLDQLPSAQREVIRQRVYEGKRFREIAVDMQCPLNTALARMHDGINRLRLQMGTDHE